MHRGVELIMFAWEVIWIPTYREKGIAKRKDAAERGCTPAHHGSPPWQLLVTSCVC